MPAWWHPRHWEDPLTRFVKATGLALSVYDLQLVRRFGPMVHYPLARALQASGGWEPDGDLLSFERELVRRAVEDAETVEAQFEDTFAVVVLPFKAPGEEVQGAFVLGWTLSHFADPLSCERVAQRLGIPTQKLWLAAREQQPVSSEKLTVYCELLETLAGAIAGQLLTVESLGDTNRMKDEFLAMVSHELKTPITSAKLRVTMLQKHLAMTVACDDERIRVHVDALERAIAAQVRLIEDLVDSSRVITGKLRLDVTTVELVDVVRSALETIRPAAEARSIELVVDLDHPITDVRGDAGRLEQLFWNLLSNAVKFTRPGGRISVSMEVSPRDRTVVIEDTGQGIDRAFLPYVFDRFSQSLVAREQASREGLGLGLALVKHLTELHGGAVTAESEGKGTGTCFRVTLPAVR